MTKYNKEQQEQLKLQAELATKLPLVDPLEETIQTIEVARTKMLGDNRVDAELRDGWIVKIEVSDIDK